MIDAADLRTFKQIAAEMPAFTYHRLRYLWDNREKNGRKNSRSSSRSMTYGWL